MIILRTMGTIKSWQATLPVRYSHDANCTPNEAVDAPPTGRRERSHAYFVTLAPCCAHSAWTSLCRAHLVGRRRSGLQRVAPRMHGRDVAYPVLSRSNASLGKVGYTKATGNRGQTGTPHFDSDSHRHRACPDPLTSGPASGNATRRTGAADPGCSVSIKGDLQRLNRLQTSPKVGVSID